MVILSKTKSEPRHDVSKPQDNLDVGPKKPLEIWMEREKKALGDLSISPSAPSIMMKGGTSNDEKSIPTKRKSFNDRNFSKSNSEIGLDGKVTDITPSDADAVSYLLSKIHDLEVDLNAKEQQLVEETQKRLGAESLGRYSPPLPTTSPYAHYFLFSPLRFHLYPTFLV